MIYAIDTNIIYDIFFDDTVYSQPAKPAAANAFLTHTYRKGWEIPGLSG